MRLLLDHAGSGLAARDSTVLTGFAIGGSDGKFVPAQALIAGDSLLVSSPEVPEPAEARYA